MTIFHILAVGRAVYIAQEISKFPAGCLKLDMETAYHAAYSSATEDELLQEEFERGIKIIKTESIPGTFTLTL